MCHHWRHVSQSGNRHIDWRRRARTAKTCWSVCRLGWGSGDSSRGRDGGPLGRAGAAPARACPSGARASNRWLWAGACAPMRPVHLPAATTGRCGPRSSTARSSSSRSRLRRLSRISGARGAVACAHSRAPILHLCARAQGAALPAHLPAPLLYHVAADRLRNAWDDTRQPPPELRPARLCARPFPTRAYCVRARCMRPPRAVQTTLYVLPGFACLLIRTRLHTRQEMVRTPSGAPTRAPGRPARHPHSTAASQERARVLFTCGYSILVTFLMSCTATLYFLKTFFVRSAPRRRRRHARAPPHMRACTPTARRRPFLGPSPTRWSAMPRCSLSSHSCPSKRR